MDCRLGSDPGAIQSGPGPVTDRLNDYSLSERFSTVTGVAFDHHQKPRNLQMDLLAV